ncbi:MAG: DUF1552 domain-containing protein [Planctomycetes bacterium]|nr:DUF1552 domain-containing protein [Planctomycetota bacterium]
MKLSRRHFLRSTGVSLALPWLEAFAPKVAYGAPALKPRRRMVCICSPLGLQPAYFFPEKAGKDYELSAYLEIVKEYRNDFTVISGLSHPNVGASHDSHNSFLTAAPHPEQRSGFRNSISVDQLAGEHLRGQTRFTTLSLGESPLAWTRSGAPVPMDHFPSSVFAKLFIEGRPDEVEAQARRLRDGQSILDSVRDQAKQMQPALGANDREKLDEYFTSVRELEQRLASTEEWSKKPKPKVDAKPPRNVTDGVDLISKCRIWFDLIHLALQTDSSRLVTLDLLGTSGVPPIQGVTFGHHDLTHNGRDPVKIEQLKKLEVEKMKTFAIFLKLLKETKEEGVSLLDRTTVFFSSNLGDASTHGVKNLPILLAGGGYKHGQHLAYDQKDPVPLSNLFVTMLQRLGVETDKFGSSTGTLTGLDMVG